MSYRVPVQASKEDSHTLTFFNYLERLFEHLEHKITKVLPEEDAKKLDVSNLVHYGQGQQREESPVILPKPKFDVAC